MKIALLQLNFIVGDVPGNAQRIISAVKKAAKKGADLCITSELALTGYPPRDFLLNNTFIQKTLDTVFQVAQNLKNLPALLLGAVERNPSGEGRPLYNAAFLLDKGAIQKTFRKTLLPSYDVFDEDRYFEPELTPQLLEYQNVKFGVTICEDIWNEKELKIPRRYAIDPLTDIIAQNIHALINISASPFSLGKQLIREKMLRTISQKYNVPVIYVNQVGGNDDLVFDGRSSFFNKTGRLVARSKPFKEDILIIDLDAEANNISPDDFSQEAESWQALVCGTRDYITKCGFSKTILGLSGGIDSAVTAAIAVEAIGNHNVTGVLMPSPYSSKGSIDDSLTLARNLRIQTIQLPITNLMHTFKKTLKEAFAGFTSDTTEENIQSRIRGNLLMALSNKYKALLLTTGNKSELSVGYCTIYGDMSGGLAVIADVPKTLVYKIAEWLNTTQNFKIPQAIIDKVPSAELKPNQTDQDSLPPYDVLDAILQRHIEQHKSGAEIIAEGFEKNTVLKILNLVKNAEFKRKQAAPGIKITDRAFGTGWRMPIACKKEF